VKIQIKNRWDFSVIFECEADSMKLAVELAVKSNADLSSADLRSADLRSADLRSADLSLADLSLANLRSADLRSADLSSANLRSADLSSANLRSADLSSANLSLANLRSADLSSANLSLANLRSANLRSANLSLANLRSANLSLANLRSADLSLANLRSADLSSANLSSANLSFIRDDIWAVLSCAPSEVEELRQALIDGKVDGSHYTGTCACLVGTIANVRGCSYENLGALKPNSSRASERFFMGIKKGDTPETNAVSKLALEWIDLWLFNMKNTFGKHETTL
jgi:hypothetical protein